MNRHLLRISLIALLMCLLMVFAGASAVVSAAAADKTDAEAVCIPNEVVVMFNSNAVKDSNMSLKAARRLENVAPDYGSISEAVGEGNKAAADAKGEVAILSDSLGDGFVIEDSMIFDAGSSGGGASALSVDEEAGSAAKALTLALVSSDKYDTETMIRKLSENDMVAAAEPNYCISLTGNEPYADYSINDTYSSYLYQANSPEAENKAGDSVSTRNADTDQSGHYLSINASSGWSKLTGNEKESVVAVVDTGVRDTHEDLSGMMWDNDPDKTGLAGVHGYDFYTNSESSNNDDVGHGTHCAGVIAAEANNNKGTVGITSGANVKIMALKIMGMEAGSGIYSAYGAYNYALRARQNGVNVVATSNSWSLETERSTVFDSIINLLGEQGILTYISAANEASDMDRIAQLPLCSESPYTVVVGAAGIDGKPANFSNYGKSTVDVYGPGMNILSTVGYDSYFPTIYPGEQFKETTEYYGEFSEDTEIQAGASEYADAVTPSKGTRSDDSIAAFGRSVFTKQRSNSCEEDYTIPDDARCEMEIIKGHSLSASSEHSLKVTIKNAQYGEEYYLYFPYEKNPATTGDDNTRFSITYEPTEGESKGEAYVSAGEVIEQDGRMNLTGGGLQMYDIGKRTGGCYAHIDNRKGVVDPDNPTLLSYEAAGAEDVTVKGMGLRISYNFTAYGMWNPGDSHDLTFYIDSLAVSRPDTEISNESSYEVMSGTSMACPAVAGAGALLAALDPIDEDQTGSEYAEEIKSRLLSCVSKTDALNELCSTGGYVDLRKLGASAPAIADAVCDLKNETITLKGADLKGCTISYRRLAQNGAEEVTLPSGGMTVEYSDDGKTAIIRKAKNLFGTYTEFKASRDGETARGVFFLVKGQKKISKVGEKMTINNGEQYNPLFRHLVTNADGTELFGVNLATGVISHYDGEQFNDIDGTEIDMALFDWLEESGQLERYDLYNDFSTGIGFMYAPLNDGNMIYQRISLDAGGYYVYFFASLDLSDARPHWTFTEMAELPDIPFGIDYEPVVMNGKLYAFVPSGDNEGSTPGTMPVWCYDIASNTWTRIEDLPYDTRQPLILSHDGKIYFMFGHDVLNPHSSAEDGLTDKVYCLDGNSWKQLDDVRYIGRFKEINGIAVHFERCAEVKNGFVFMDSSVDGAGNVFLYNTETGKCEPMYYSIGDALSDSPMDSSCVETRDGIYYIVSKEDELKWGYELYFLPASSGAYESKYEPKTPPAPEKKPALNRSSASLKAGKNSSLKVSNGKAVRWFSSKPSVAKVSSSGKVTALKKGSATIYAVLKGGTYLTCKVKVTTSPKLSKKSITVKKGKTKTVKITGKAAGVKNVYKNTKKAKVVSKRTSSVIKVKGLKKGKTTLKIKVNGVTLKLKVTVK